MTENHLTAARAALEAAEQSTKAARLLLESLSANGSGDELLSVEQTKAEPEDGGYGVGRIALKNAAAKGEIQLVTGSRGKILVRRSELERWLASKPYTPKAKPTSATAPTDSWEERAERRLKSISGGRRR